MSGSIGTLSAKVVANASGFEAGMVAAQKSAEKLSQGLRDQLLTLQMGEVEFERFKMRLAGVKDETIALIHEQQNQIARIQQLNSAMERMGEGQRNADLLAASLQDQVLQLTMGAQAFEQYQLRLQGVDAATIQLITHKRQEIEAIHAEAAAVKQAEEAMRQNQVVAQKSAETMAYVRNMYAQPNMQIGGGSSPHQAVADQLSGSLRDQILLLQMGEREFERYKLRLAGVNDSTIQLIMSQRTQLQTMQASVGGSQKGMYALQQLAFGAQDAATVFGTMGFAGAVRASSNNVIQFASLLHPLAGLLAAVAGTGIALWVDHMDKASKSGGELNRIVEEHERRLKALIDTIKEAGKITAEFHAIRNEDKAGGAENKAENLRKEIAQLEAEKTRLDEVKAKFKEIDDARTKQRLDVERDIKRFDREEGAGLGAGLLSLVYNPRKDELNGLKAQEEKSKEQHIKLIEEENRIRKEMRQKQEMLEEAARREEKLKEQKDMLDRLKIREEELKEFKKIKEKQREEEEKAEKNRNDLKKHAQEHTPQGKRQNLIDAATERAKKLQEAGFAPEELQRLLDANAEGLRMELLKTYGKHDTLAGAASFGSTEAYSAIAKSQMPEAQLSAGEKAIVDKLKIQNRKTDEVKQEIKDIPKINVIGVA